MRVVSRVVLAALLAVAGRAAAQEPPAAAAPVPVPEAVQNELRSVQELLARAAVEFDGPEQSRSIVLLDEVVGRLEAFRRQGTLPGRHAGGAFAMTAGFGAILSEEYNSMLCEFSRISTGMD